MFRRVLAVLVAVVSCGWCSAVAVRAEGACPNEAIRLEQGSTLLPDCRAYEMVSPAYQEGAPVIEESLSGDGDRAIVRGLDNLAGTPGTAQTSLDGSLYMETRGVGGWQVAPLNVPMNEFVGQIPLAQEAESGLSLWNQHTPEQSVRTRGLYIRSADGKYSYVGPLDPHDTSGEEPSDTMEITEAEYDTPVAGTSDYGHIVLKARTSMDLWVFDNTKSEHSLYEYSGTDNLEGPVLVGVRGPRGSRQLVGECGAVLGGGELGSELNALSGDGETVFFTVEPVGTFGCSASAPLTAEVYARRFGSQVSTAPPETVDVSESECTVACGSEESGKSFEGASEDGDRVYFSSTQKLTDDATDATASGNAFKEGGCALILGGGGCNLYEYEFLPHQQHVLKLVAGGAEVLGVAGIAEDGSRIYFVARKVISGSGENEYGRAAVEEQPNLYVYDVQSGSTKFITTLNERETSDEKDWVKPFGFRSSEVTGGNGQFLLFASGKQGPGVTPDTEGGLVQLFEYDAETGELVRVTQGENGYNHNGNGVSSGVNPETVSLTAKQAEGFRVSGNVSNMSFDGRTVVFETAGELSPFAVSAGLGCTSVYEFRSEGAISQGGVHLLSDGRDVLTNKGSQCGAQFKAMDDEGENILFSTDDPLTAGDVDGGQRSLYDARVDGGFGSSAGAASCAGTGCEAPTSTPPGPSAPGSSSLSGSGNIAPSPPLLPPAPKLRISTRAQKLAKALKECKKDKAKTKQAICERQARVKYGPLKSTKKKKK